MKLLTIFFLLFTALTFSQSNSGQNILSLKEDIKKESLQKNDFDHMVELNSMQSSRKNPALAILYSLLLPGMGELYAESYSSGKYFTIAEGVLWGVYLGMNSYAGWQKDRYESFAESNGGVNLNGKDDQYFATIGSYIDIDQYNDEKALDRNFSEMYPRESYFWKWSDNSERKEYRDMWSSSEQTYNDLRFVVGALIVNRIASAVNAVRMVSAYNNRLEDELSWNISVGLDNKPNLPTSLTLNFQTSF